MHNTTTNVKYDIMGFVIKPIDDTMEGSHETTWDKKKNNRSQQQDEAISSTPIAGTHW